MVKFAPDFDGDTFEEYEEWNRKNHPEWFDENGNRLPTKITGVRAPGGIYIPEKSFAERGITANPEQQGSNIPLGWRPSVEEPIPVVRCVKIKKDGKQCNRWSLRGSTVCYVHGGKMPEVQKKAAAVVEAARLKLLGLSEEAVDVLDDLIKPGTPDAVRLKAAQDILDRAGLKGAVDVTLTVDHKVDAGSLIAERLDRIAGKSTDDDNDDEDIVDAEVEDDEDVDD